MHFADGKMSHRIIITILVYMSNVFDSFTCRTWPIGVFVTI